MVSVGWADSEDSSGIADSVGFGEDGAFVADGLGEEGFGTLGASGSDDDQIALRSVAGSVADIGAAEPNREEGPKSNEAKVFVTPVPPVLPTSAEFSTTLGVVDVSPALISAVAAVASGAAGVCVSEGGLCDGASTVVELSVGFSVVVSMGSDTLASSTTGCGLGAAGGFGSAVKGVVGASVVVGVVSTFGAGEAVIESAAAAVSLELAASTGEEADACSSGLISFLSIDSVGFSSAGGAGTSAIADVAGGSAVGVVSTSGSVLVAGEALTVGAASRLRETSSF